jgi:peptidoglycan hydrolase-like protein with peptidoglycan-binding domain
MALGVVSSTTGSTPAAAAAAAWTLPVNPPKCTSAQADAGDVAGCVLTLGDTLPETRGWPTPPFPDPTDQQPLPWVDLTIGATGLVVARLQTALIAAGQDLAADGQFGPLTAAAVAAYQTANKLTATGIADAATAAKLGVQNTTPGTFPPAGWQWTGWGYNGSAVLAAWEAQLIGNPSPIGAMKAGQLRAFPDALPLFTGFYAEIQARGYRISDGGTYVFRCTASTRKDCAGLTRASLSNHAYGLASDINTVKNPQRTYYAPAGGTACRTPMVTDMPQWVVDTAMKWGLYWGGFAWSSGCDTLDDPRGAITRDPMHFEFNGTPLQAHMILRHNVGAGQCVDTVTELGEPVNWCMLSTDIPPAGTRLVVKTDAPAGAKAALVNIIATVVEKDGYLTAEDCAARPLGVRPWSNGDTRVGRINSWSTIVPIDAQGRFCIYLSTPIHVVVDVQGFFSPSAAAPNGNVFTPIVTQRTMDSRTTGPPVGPAIVTPQNSTTSLTPVAALTNLTATEATTPGFLTADTCPSMAPGPQSHSNVNFTDKELSVTNLAVVPVTPVTGGVQFCTFVNQLTHEVVDVLGFFGPPDQGGLGYTATPPARVLDTRECWTDAVTGGQQCGAMQTPASVVHLRAPPGTSSVVVSVKSVNATTRGLLLASACSTVANHGFISPAVQAVANGVVTNLAVVPVDPDGTYCLTFNATMHVVVDQVGTFSPTGDLRFVPITPRRLLDTRPPG